MSNLPPKPVRTTGLSPKEQKLQALREKLAGKSAAGAKQVNSFAGPSAKVGSGPARKTAFQRKAT